MLHHVILFIKVNATQWRRLTNQWYDVPIFGNRVVSLFLMELIFLMETARSKIDEFQTETTSFKAERIPAAAGIIRY